MNTNLKAGFSVFELMLVITIASVIASLGWPSLAKTVARVNLRIEINALYHALHQARRESIKRNRYVALCKTTDGARCDPNLDWHAGWMIFVDEDQDYPPQRDLGETLISLHRPKKTVTLQANRNAFVVRTVRRRTTNGTFVACDIAGRVAPLALVLSYTGRPRSTDASNVLGRLPCP